MEERIYHGKLQAQALAKHLVMTFDGKDDLAAQSVGQGDQTMVQIGRKKMWTGRIRSAIGISVSQLSDGLQVVTGQSNWFELADPAVGGMLLGSLLFPPLLLFPLMRGIRQYTLYQEIWMVIDEYCTQAQATEQQRRIDHAIYCQNCGAANDEQAQQCHFCGMPFTRSDDPYALSPEKSYYIPRPRLVQCPRCDAMVPAGKYCNNCASLLPPEDRS